VTTEHKPQNNPLPPRVQIVETGAHVDGASVRIRNDEGWLHVIVTADESIIGYAVTVNGKDLPYQPEQA
jgi:hypothetical protein